MTKKERDYLLKNKEFVKEMMDEREEPESELQAQEVSPSLEEKLAELEIRISNLEKVFVTLEEKNVLKDVKFPGTKGTIGKIPEVKFPRQSGSAGDYYISYN